MNKQDRLIEERERVILSNIEHKILVCKANYHKIQMMLKPLYDDITEIELMLNDIDVLKKAKGVST